MSALRLALRSMWRSPVFALSALFSMVLGISVTGAVFVVLYGVLLAPSPYRDPDQLISIELKGADQRSIGQPPALYLTLGAQTSRLQEIGYYRTGSANVGLEGVGEVSERVTATWVSASTLPMLGVSPLFGRTFIAAEERRDGPQAVILSEAEWRRRFAAAPDVIGQVLTVNSVPRIIIGVMPAEFAFPDVETRLWLPARFNTTSVIGDFIYTGVARLTSGTSAQQAEAELASVLPRMAEAFPTMASGEATAAWLDEEKPRPVVQPLHESLTRDLAPMLWVLAAAAMLVLLVALANLANLMLVRADARSSELAVRAALGAGRLRIVAHFLPESLLLGGVAALIAWPIVSLAVHGLAALGPPELPRLHALQIGMPTLVCMAAVVILCVVVCTTVPLFRTRANGESNPLREAARGVSTGVARQRLREGIAALQIALALAVTTGSVVLMRTAIHLQAVDPGFDGEDVMLVQTLLPYARYDNARTVVFHERLIERVWQLGNVQAAGIARLVPLRKGESLIHPFRIKSAPSTSTRSLPLNTVDSGFFQALRVPLLAGHLFDARDPQRGRSIVLSRRAAEQLAGNQSFTSLIGQSLTMAPDGPADSIIGIVGDVRYQDLAMASEAMVYRPHVVPADPAVEAETSHAMTLVVRAKSPSSALLRDIRAIVSDLDPEIATDKVVSMQEVIRASKVQRMLALRMTAATAAVALLLGMIGLYGVMAYWVALRTREFGIRLALGADAMQIARIVALRGIGLTLLGVVAGWFVYASGVPLLRAFLFGVSETDPATLAVAALLVMLASALAIGIPTHRAMRVDPVEALRGD